MNRPLSPPGTTEEVHARSALVLAPHYDDEVLGCGGLVARLVESGAEVDVLFLTDGGEETRPLGDAPEDRQAYRVRRRAEAEAAARVLGLDGIEHLDLPDGALDQHLGSLAEGIRRTLEEKRPELVLVTSPLEGSVDHRAAFAALHQVLAETRLAEKRDPEPDSLRVLAYEVNQPLYPDLLVDVSAEVEKIRAAMVCYESQQERHDYLAASLGLKRFRALTLKPGVEAVEAYRRLAVEDFFTHSPASLVAELGGAPAKLEVTEGPRISVIVRTRNRPELLAEALASLARSTYRRAEVLVVNDGGKTPELPEDFSLELRLVDLEGNVGRAAAANAGIRAAEGEYVAFLDDDDLALPEHLQTLAGLVSAAGVRVAYTDAAASVYELSGDGWSEVERRLPYSRDFDPELLHFDNYIPFNTVLVERCLVDEVGELDPELPFFEDWDFLLRLAEKTRFHHLPRVTCEYRQFRGAGHHILGDLPRQRDDFLAVKERVLERHAARRTASATARVIDRLRAETVASGEEVRRLRRELADAEARHHELNGRFQASEVRQATLQEWRDRLIRELEEERAEHRRLDRETERLFARERELAATAAEQEREIARLQGREGELEESLRRELAAWERRHEDALAEAHAARGDVAEKLRLMSEQEARVAEELRATYAEIERLNGEIARRDELVRTMESTRAWRAHQWWQRHKP